ncbi:hypothetical protein [Haloarcula pellucida]|uniref:Uncharacterized protein n=1 Tax=Haloarcula pellucida TaxID=1427151 RepID=A0A830GPB8_9EURY|nr:hypothetical protein [Halomicroarcula pellucida]MBX0350383.1 hypothetical protein [Halomicroarcula pellucida]GGO01815.1 hypothetical protein GCM10009030_35870 [Halomicroarcula pellucida]
MSSTEVDWVLDQLASVVSSVATDYTLENGDDVVIKRVDRDDSRIYEGSQAVDMTTPIRSRSGELQSGVFVSAGSADVSQSPIGTEFDLDVERVVSLRAEGLHHSEWGHVDPDGTNGVPFGELQDRIRSALYGARTYPDAGRTGTSYTHLLLTNEADLSSEYADFYDWRVDVAFDGFEELP